MKRKMIFALLCIFGMVHLSAQELNKNENPDEQIIVKKEYDENGNLIKYDSTYVHQWSPDSTFTFPFEEDFAFDGSIRDFMNNFMNDSLMTGFGFPHHFSLPLFDEDFFMNPLDFSFPDSLLLKQFRVDHDSLFNRNFSFHHSFPHDFGFPDMDEIHKKMEEHLNQFGFENPDFKSKQQQDEWEKLMEKQQKEKEEFLKKWEKEK